MALPHSIRSTVTVLFILSALTLSAQEYQFTWDGGGSNNKYETARNWDTDSLPALSGENTMSVLLDSGTMIFDDLSGRQVIDQLDVNNGAVLHMKGGHFDHSRSGATIRTSVGITGKSLSVVNQSGGRFTIGHLLRIGYKNSKGQYNLTGGILEIFRGGRSLMYAPHSASISIGSGASESELIISGGELHTRAGIEIGAAATFSVLGNSATAIGVGTQRASDHGSWHQLGTLTCEVGPRGITKIYVAAGDQGGQSVHFLEGSKLNMHFHGTRPINGEWVIMELEGASILDDGLALSEAASENPGWTFVVDNSARNGRLIAKYSHYVGVPEARYYSLMLSAVLGVFVICRRRRRA